MLRVKEVDYRNNENIEELIGFLRPYKGLLDSLSFFDSTAHDFLPYSGFRKKLGQLENAIIRAKEELRLKAGINMLSTLGHIEESGDFLLPEDFRPMVNYDGRPARGIPCPSSENFIEDVRLKYRSAAELNPDFIWVDDDLRMCFHNPVKLGCFCDLCIEKFNVAHRTCFTRERVVREFLENSADNYAFTSRFLSWLNAPLVQIAGVIHDAVFGVSQEIVLGLMISNCTYGYSEAIASLRDRSDRPVLIRPGGGFWKDEVPVGFIRKSLKYAAQIECVKAGPDDIILAEIENFPNNFPVKSRHIICQEISGSIAAGCRGATLNITGSVPNSLPEYLPLMETLKGKKSYWSILEKETRDLPLAGAWVPSNSPAHTLRAVMGKKENMKIPGSPENLNALGVPLTSDFRHGYVTILTGASIQRFSSDDLDRIFTGGVMLDGSALAEIEERRLSKYAGGVVKDRIQGYCVEKNSSAAFCCGEKNVYRDSRPGFFDFESCVFELTEEGAEGISELLKTAESNDSLGKSAFIFENHLGGRVAAFGYDPWLHIYSAPKITQLHKLLDWLSRGEFPFMVNYPSRIHPFLRYDKNDGHMTIILFNASFDPVDEVGFTSAYKIKKAEFLDGSGVWKSMAIPENHKSFQRVSVKLAPWDNLVVKFSFE